MHDNQTRIPCGEYPIFVDNSTKAWVELTCVVRIRINNKDDIRVLPNETKNTSGYPVTVKITDTPNGLSRIDLKQEAGDRRTYSIRQLPNSFWMLTVSKWKKEDWRPIECYPLLFPALSWLITQFKKE